MEENETHRSEKDSGSETAENERIIQENFRSFIRKSSKRFNRKVNDIDGIRQSSSRRTLSKKVKRSSSKNDVIKPNITKELKPADSADSMEFIIEDLNFSNSNDAGRFLKMTNKGYNFCQVIDSTALYPTYYTLEL